MIHKKNINKYFESYVFFYRNLQFRLFIALILSILVAFFDGLGLSMFLPLLEMVDGKQEATAKAMGNLSFLPNLLNTLGFSLNLKTILLIMLLFFSLKGLSKFLEIYYRVILQQYFIKKLRLDNIYMLSNFNYEAFALADVGRIQNTLSGETERVVQAYKNFFSAAQMTVMLFVYIFLAFLANPQFALFVTFGGLLSNSFFNLIYKKTKKISLKVTNENHKFQRLLIEKVAFFKYLKATAFNFVFSNKLENVAKSIESGYRKIGFHNAIIQGIREPMIMSIVFLVVLIQVNFLEQSLGIILLSLLFFYRSLTFLMALQTSWNGFLAVSGSLFNMIEFQKSLSSNQDSLEGKSLRIFSNKIQFIDVGFHFNEKKILNSVNFEIHKNKSYAFIGESGSGKTTLVNLISGLLRSTEGEILIDGINYRDINISSFQKRLGYITQDPVIFNDTIYNNITLWSPQTKFNLEKFWTVVDKASLMDFIKEIDDKENAVLGNNGINLSGGQKQRISIARELFKDIDILIMDEATSSLDSITERIVSENIESLRGKLTLIIIAHRISTIKNVDLVFYIQNGRLNGIGSFNELRENNVKFKELIANQSMI